MTPDWWPAWAGEDMVLVASGPSASTVPLDLARGGHRVIAINESWRLAPWADILYACDHAWWAAHDGVPEFRGLRLTVDHRAATAFGIPLMKCRKPDPRVLMDRPGEVGWGGNSGFHVLNLALQFGPRKIILVGYDMRVDRGSHWHGAHPEPMHNPSEKSVGHWRRAVEGAAKVAAAHGIRVINASMDSALRRFPKLAFEEAVAQ